MKMEKDSLAESEFNAMDRRIIQVDLTPTQAGITAALRRAFQAAASEPSSRDFDDLLRRLN
jgi:DNA-binding MarR family transcriptional regulator